MRDWCKKCKIVVPHKSKIFKETGLCDKCYKESNPQQPDKPNRADSDHSGQVELFN